MSRTTAIAATVAAAVVVSAAAFVVLNREAIADPAVLASVPPPPVQPVQPAPVSSVPAQTDRVVVEGSGVASDKTGDLAAVRLAAERAAKLDALRKLVEKAGALVLDDGRSFAAAYDKSVVVGVASGFKVVDTKYFSDGSVEVVAVLTYDVVDEAIAPARVRRPQ